MRSARRGRTLRRNFRSPALTSREPFRARRSIELARVNDEVWLPKSVSLKLSARVALLKNFNVVEDVSYRDYKKFRSDTKIVPVPEAR